MSILPILEHDTPRAFTISFIDCPADFSSLQLTTIRTDTRSLKIPGLVRAVSLHAKRRIRQAYGWIFAWKGKRRGLYIGHAASLNRHLQKCSEQDPIKPEERAKTNL